ncbi:MAG: PAS domain S-box protein [Halapricum sp.]
MTVSTNDSEVVESIERDRPGPDCVLLGDEDPDVEALSIVRRIRDVSSEIPIVLCTAEPASYGAQAVLEAGVTDLITESDLEDRDAVRETIQELGQQYRNRVQEHQDASLLETMLERLPVHLFAKDRSARHVRVSSALHEPSALLGKTDFETWSAHEPGDRSHEADRRVLDGESIHNEEEYSAVRDGWSLVSKVPWYDEGEIVGLAGLAIDVTDQKQREEELAATTQLLSTVVQTSPAAILVHDADGTVQFWNTAATELFGWTAEEAIRQPRPPFVTADTRPEFESLVDSVIENGTLGPREIRRQTRDGEWLDLQLSAAALSEDGEPERIVAFLTNVTDLKERERRLKRQNDRLEQFTRVLAHDLRNPVQVVRGQLERGDALDPLSIERAIDRIQAIVEDVLAVARSDPLVTDTSALPLTTVARDVWQQFDAPNASLSIESTCTFEGNRARVYRLLDHLFENAVQHGGPSVTITVGSLDDGFYVEDDGPGIDEGEQERVFEPGYSTEPHATGFGLNIVREITEAHGWQIDLAGTDGGARFEVRGVDST